MGALRKSMQKKESTRGLQNPDRRQARNPAFHAGCAHQAAQYKERLEPGVDQSLNAQDGSFVG